MKGYQKTLAIAIGSVLAISLFAGCGGGEGPTPSGSDSEAVIATICYDNLPEDGISLSEEDTTVTVEGLDPSTFTVRAPSSQTDYTKIATYDAASGVFTAVGPGTLTYTDSKGATGRITVVPAYVEDPGNQYGGSQDLNEEKSTVLGHTHDPSFVEVVRKNGTSEYYLFSTGWDTRTRGDSGETYGNAIHYSRDLITWEYLGRTFDYATRDEDFISRESGKWLYDGTLSSTKYSPEKASWWAPDIVPCPDGGYWLYTCVVDGAGDNDGMMIAGGNYARACILLYHSDSLSAGSFKPVLDKEGKQVVLMQSSIRRGESEKDVNGIDPQIIYTPEGKMYMAYGSFGSGNYILELDPATGCRKDGKGWQTHEEIRQYVADVQDDFGTETSDSIGWVHDYYGTNISKANMEAPVIARHDNVTVMDEDGKILESGKTYYYSMHSYDGLGDNYQMWGGRSESVLGVYKSVSGGIVRNIGPGRDGNSGNKYMGAFEWSSKAAGVSDNDVRIILPGHNDLYTAKDGTSLAAYITRLPGSDSGDTSRFVTQVHQYYLNSYGHIVINPNRYAQEIDRSVSEEELLHYTQTASDGAYQFKMVVMVNQRDTKSGDFREIQNVSRDVLLKSDHTITEKDGTALGTWKMYGKGYIKFTFTSELKGTGGVGTGETVYYGVVRPAWLTDQNKSGFTITCLGGTEGTTRSLAMFMNNYSTLTGGALVG